ncbi:hypothetical protein ACQR0V_10465 [Bradyrhizobium sp. HKCCYLS2058]
MQHDLSLEFGSFPAVMAGLFPAIHVVRRAKNGVDARDKPGHDDVGTGE